MVGIFEKSANMLYENLLNFDMEDYNEFEWIEMDKGTERIQN